MPKYILEEEKFNVKYSDYVEEKYLDIIPLFAQSIFANESLDDEEKYKFYNNFLIKYFEDPKYKDDTEGLLIFFYFGYYIGPYPEYAIDNCGGIGNGKYCFVIEKNPVLGCLK